MSNTIVKTAGGKETMKIEVYDSENYDSWEDAEKNGAIYELYLSDRVKSSVPRELIEEIVHGMALAVETCVRYEQNVMWRIVE